MNEPSVQELLAQAVRKESRKKIQRAIELGADVNRVFMKDIHSVEILEYLQELGMELELEEYIQLLLATIEGPEEAVIHRVNMELVYYIFDIFEKTQEFRDEIRDEKFEQYLLNAYEICLERNYDSIAKMIEPYLPFSTTKLLIMAAFANNKTAVERMSTELRLPEQLRDQLALLMTEYLLSNSINRSDIENFEKQLEDFIEIRNDKLWNAVKNNDEKLFEEAIEDGATVCEHEYLEMAIRNNNINIVKHIAYNPECVYVYITRDIFLAEGLYYCVKYGKTNIFEFLLNEGANPYHMSSSLYSEKEGGKGKNLLEIAIKLERKEIVALLLNYEVDPDFPKLIKYAQKHNNTNMARFLLQKQAEYLGERNRPDLDIIDEDEQKAEGRSEERVDRYCKQNKTIRDNEPLYDDITVLFFVAGKRNARAECYSKAELKEIFSHAAPVYEMDGPPLGVSAGEYKGPRGPNENEPVYKLPWTGIWVDKSIPELVDNRASVIILHAELKSIGSGHGVGQMAGQWGGNWQLGRDDRGREIAIFMENGDAQPDERETVYYGTEGWLD